MHFWQDPDRLSQFLRFVFSESMAGYFTAENQIQNCQLTLKDQVSTYSTYRSSFQVGSC